MEGPIVELGEPDGRPGEMIDGAGWAVEHAIGFRMAMIACNHSARHVRT